MKTKRFLSHESDNVECSQLNEESVEELKAEFSKLTSRSEKLHLLTTVPKDSGIKRIIGIFNISRRIARRAKKLRLKGFGSCPQAKKGRLLSVETLENVKVFYLSEDISRTLPGMKDCISVLENGKWVLKQKKLMLLSISESYKQFLSKNADVKISLSKFKKLMSRECILADKKGMHNVCVSHLNICLQIKCNKFYRVQVIYFYVS